MSSYRIKLKTALANIVYYSGLFNFKLSSTSKEQYLVIMYHRIIPSSEVGGLIQPGMYVEPDIFELHMRFLKRYFDILPISNLYETIPKYNVKLRQKHACYLTFDDGWSDFYKYAYPILVKHQIPATVYLPTGFIGTDKLFWTDRVAHLLEFVTKNGLLVEFIDCATKLIGRNKILCKSNEDYLDTIIYKLKEYRIENIDSVISILEKQFGVSKQVANKAFMSWEQVDEMHKSGLITFGSHTVNHNILTTLSDDEVAQELYESKKCLTEKKLVDEGRVSFCYPNGNMNYETIKYLKDFNYSLAFSTKWGWNNSRNPVFELKRMGLHQDVSNSVPLLAYRIFTTPFAI